MIDLENILKKTEAIAEELVKDTDAFLDSLYDDDDKILKTEPLTITYKGVTVDIPIDFACINNEIQDFFKALNEAIKEYL